MKHTLILAATAFLFAACTQDELNSPTEGVEGAVLTFTASIEGGGLTRATVDNTWSGGETVALQINAGGWLNYTADASGNLTGNDYYWQNTDPVTVQGICPATAAGSTTWSVESDQSSYRNYQSGDLLATGVTNVNYGSAANLTFRHQTAKLVVNIVDGPIVPDDPEVTVGDNNLALTGTFTKPSSGSSFGTWTPGVQTGSITPYRLPNPNTVAEKNIKVSYAALVIPQNLKAGTKLISILIDGQSYSYSLPHDITWKPGCVYTYTITVRAEGLEVSVDDTIQDWTDGDSESGNATLPIPIYKELDDAVIGDYYMADGTVLSQESRLTEAIASKVIGIVFYAGHHESDNSDYSTTGIGQEKCHGYVVALTDVHNSSDDRLRWEYGPNQEYNKRVNASTNTGDWQGFSNSQKIHEFVENNGWEMKHFPAALACETYGNRTIDQNGNPTTAYDWQKPLAASNNTSGWFLPSCGQLSHLYANRSELSARMNTVKNSTPADCNYKDKIKWFSTSWYYWSSTEYSNSDFPNYAWFVDYYNGYPNYNLKRATRDVRAVLAF